MGIQSDIFAKKLARKMNTIIEIILAFPMITRPRSSRKDFIKNKTIVIGKPYHIPKIFNHYIKHFWNTIRQHHRGIISISFKLHNCLSWDTHQISKFLLRHSLCGSVHMDFTFKLIFIFWQWLAAVLFRYYYLASTSITYFLHFIE